MSTKVLGQKRKIDEVINTQISTQQLLEKKYKCLVNGCKYSTDKRKLLTDHGRIHKEKKHKCKQCDHKTTSLRDLQRHTVAMHTTEKNFKCEIRCCTYTAKSQLEINKHQKFHKDINLPEEKRENLMHIFYGIYTTGFRFIPDFPDYEVNEMCQVRVAMTLRILKPCMNFRVTLFKNETPYKISIYSVALRAFFPNVPERESVDHIDEDHTNNNINNLQWMSISENAKKFRRLRPEVNNQKNNPKRSKPVEQWSSDGKTFIKEYVSITEAAQQTGFHRSDIASCAANKPQHKTCHGYVWKYKIMPDQLDLPGEEWKTSERLIHFLVEKGKMTRKNAEKVQVSNMGRVLTAMGIKTKGNIMTRHPKYRRACHFKVHKLIWYGWGDRLPGFVDGKPEHILHDDSQPLDEDGCVSNAFEHLRLGTQSENILESCRIGSLSKKRKCSSP